MGDLTKNFSRSEFSCPCGCGADNISPDLVELLQAMRNSAGQGIYVTSGIRCADHNRAIGGVDSSAHVPYDLGDGEGEVGHAVDISANNSGTRFRMMKSAFLFDFQRIGIGKEFLHLDTDTRKPKEVAWDYYDDDHVG